MNIRTTALILLVMLCWNCAQQGSPAGGPKDEDPPVVLECEPANYSTHFSAKKIMITFNEYIVLDNVNQQLIVSPPMEEKPEVRLRKRTIIIEFEEDLKARTTYTFNFGSAIKDLHEGNKLLNYEYVFSTGDVLDSLSVKGTLKYAEDLTEPDDPISIMLYDDLRDSVPLTDIPLYVGRSDDSGVFSVNNLRADVYKVFALKDGNNNLLFDLPTEEIAFLDTSLIVNAEFARSLLGYKDSTVTAVKDSMEAGADTTAPLITPRVAEDDTLEVVTELPEDAADPAGDSTDSSDIESDSLSAPGPDLNSIYIDLMLFTEETILQYITDYDREDRRRLQLMFARPLTDTFQYRPFIPETGDPVEVIESFSANRDSLTLWVVDSLYYKRDTLLMEVRFTVKDTADQYVIQTDTLIYSYREPPPSKRKKETAEGEEKLEVSVIRKNGNLDLNRDLAINLKLPLKGFNDSLIQVYHIPDTVDIQIPFRTYPDTTHLTRGWISAKWEPESKYRVVLLPGAVSSIYQPMHDTIDIPFKTRDIEYYGQILLNLENVKNTLLVQLISDRKIVREMVVDKPGLTTFSYLAPKEYRIKVIHDLNMNGKWDTGKYIEKRQPEPVEFLPTEINVRSNWDHDVTMTLEK